MKIKSLYRVLVKSCNKYDGRQMLLGELPENIEPRTVRQLDIKEYKIDFARKARCYSVGNVRTFVHHLKFGFIRQQLPNSPPREQFVIDYYRFDIHFL